MSAPRSSRLKSVKSFESVTSDRRSGRLTSHTTSSSAERNSKRVMTVKSFESVTSEVERLPPPRQVVRPTPTQLLEIEIAGGFVLNTQLGSAIFKSRRLVFRLMVFFCTCGALSNVLGNNMFASKYVGSEKRCANTSYSHFGLAVLMCVCACACVFLLLHRTTIVILKLVWISFDTYPIFLNFFRAKMASIVAEEPCFEGNPGGPVEAMIGHICGFVATISVAFLVCSADAVLIGRKIKSRSCLVLWVFFTWKAVNTTLKVQGVREPESNYYGSTERFSLASAFWPAPMDLREQESGGWCGVSLFFGHFVWKMWHAKSAGELISFSFGAELAFEEEIIGGKDGDVVEEKENKLPFVEEEEIMGGKDNQDNVVVEEKENKMRPEGLVVTDGVLKAAANGVEELASSSGTGTAGPGGGGQFLLDGAEDSSPGWSKKVNPSVSLSPTDGEE